MNCIAFITDGCVLFDSFKTFKIVAVWPDWTLIGVEPEVVLLLLNLIACPIENELDAEFDCAFGVIRILFGVCNVNVCRVVGVVAWLLFVTFGCVKHIWMLPVDVLKKKLLILFKRCFIIKS